MYAEFLFWKFFMRSATPAATNFCVLRPAAANKCMRSATPLHKLHKMHKLHRLHQLHQLHKTCELIYLQKKDMGY